MNCSGKDNEGKSLKVILSFANKAVRGITNNGHIHIKWNSSSIALRLHNLHTLSFASLFLFFLIVLSKIGVYLPYSISIGKIPALNCDINERRRRDIHLVKYNSGQYFSLNVTYVRNFGIFPMITRHCVS